MKTCFIFSLTFIILFFTNMSSNSAEISIDNLDRIRNKYDPILFTIKSIRPGTALVRVESNGEEYPALTLYLGDSLIKGILWFSVRNIHNVSDLNFILSGKNKLKIKFVLLNGLDTDNFNKIKHGKEFFVSELYDENSKLPSYMTMELADIELPIHKLINENVQAERISNIIISIYKNLSQRRSGYIGTKVELSEENFLVLTDFSDTNSLLSDIVSLLLLLHKMNEKIDTHCKKVMEKAIAYNRQGKNISIEDIFAELTPLLNISSDKEELLTRLSCYRDTFLYHIFYPTAYVGCYIEEFKWQEAKILLDEYEKKYIGDSLIMTAVNKEIVQSDDDNLKQVSGLEGDYITKTFDEIIKDNKLTEKKKIELFEAKISKLRDNKELSPDLIYKIIIKIYELLMSNPYPSSVNLFICLQAIQPDDASIDEITNYEKGIVLFFENEQDFIENIKRKYPYCKTFYERNRCTPISICTAFERNTMSGKILYTYLKSNYKDKNSVLAMLKKESDNAVEIKSLLKILEQRYGMF